MSTDEKNSENTDIENDPKEVQEENNAINEGNPDIINESKPDAIEEPTKELPKLDNLIQSRQGNKLN